jgi:hypothetical protein
MASWGFAKQVLLPHKGTNIWTEQLSFGLPASRQKNFNYSPEQLYRILTSKDRDFTLGHLQTLFSLLEEFVKEIIKHYHSKERKSYFDSYENLKKFLLAEHPFESFKHQIEEERIIELKLARETRNCFIHNFSRVDSKWIKAYECARKLKTPFKEGQELPLLFEEVEIWHDLTIEIVNEIYLNLKELNETS